ncbi:hypothetical protein [Metapseudomonas boanensis]|uniref:Uncharacterized protein n=1 Tax=Metapseudomonas boanensis TaxID=2822138 RepID=A0ABS5XDJ5_9GAMM|nr:hypothetical protein [Pseudomonas boanensis]MBT8765735.1 hypothetical protein [Pseudomonas boanensis]
MHGPEPEDGRHSTPDEDPRPRLWPRFLLSLALLGLLVGLMIGRLTSPEPAQLKVIEVHPDALVLWFEGEPEVREAALEGAYAVWLGAEGEAAKGRLRMGSALVSWHLQASQGGMLLRFVSVRGVRGGWQLDEREGRWRLAVELREE